MWPEWTNTLSWWQWGVLATVPPAIVALYFLKLRRRTVEVPSTYLWHRAAEDLRVNSLWQRLRNTLLLLLQLAAVALLLLALGRPSWQTQRRLASRTIFLIDNSASMASTDVRPSRLAEAKRRVLDRIGQMQADDVAMVISFSDVAQVEQPYTSNRVALRDAVRNVAQTQRPTNLAEAMKLAAGLANPSKTGDLNEAMVAEAKPADVLIYSDGRFGDVKDFAVGNLNPMWIPIGNPEGRNIGIVGLAASTSDANDRLQIFTRLFNGHPVSQEVDVELYRDNTLVDADRVTLEPDERRGIVFEMEPTEQAVFEVRLAVEDDFALDNRAWLAINAPRRLRVLVITPGNPPLQRALSTVRARERAEVTFVAPDFLNSEQYAQLAGSGGLDLIVYDRCRPAQPPQTNTLFIGRVPQWNGWSPRPPVPAPQVIDIEQAHPLMQWVEMGDVLLAEAAPLALPEAAVALIDSDAGPLAAIAPRQEFEDVVLGFEVYSEKRAVTNWILRPSFPVFVLNTLQYFDRRWATADQMAPAIRPGQEIVLPLPDQDARLVLPDGSTTTLAPAATGKTHFTRTDQLGVYALQVDQRVAYRFAVNLADPQESRVAVDPQMKRHIGNVSLPAVSGSERSRREFWKWLVAAALVVLVVEWLVYRRRIAPRRTSPRFSGRQHELSEAWVG